MRVRVSDRTDGLYNQHGYIKNGKVYILNGNINFHDGFPSHFDKPRFFESLSGDIKRCWPRLESGADSRWKRGKNNAKDMTVYRQTSMQSQFDVSSVMYPNNAPSPPFHPGPTSEFMVSGVPSPTPVAGETQIQYMPVPSATLFPPVPQKDEAKSTSSGLLPMTAMPNTPAFEWTIEMVSEWILRKGLPAHVAQTLSVNGIDGAQLLLLTEPKLHMMGIASPEICQTIQACLDKLREESFGSRVEPTPSGDGAEVPPPYMSDGVSTNGLDVKASAV
ncbi:hypothetical protein HDU67_009740 [Dinochytrium kinnereticum]|nr:hypothetical protein HDU67_009740 [Dinochytrium kinnereticum]